MKTENILMLIIIIIILLIISGIIAPRFFKENKYDRPHTDPLYRKFHIITTGINVYKLHTVKLPKSLEDLIICPIGLEKAWQGPYLKERQLNDPWGNPFVYEPNSAANHGYDLISYGADGLPGGKGYDMDITNN